MKNSSARKACQSPETVWKVLLIARPFPMTSQANLPFRTHCPIAFHRTACRTFVPMSQRLLRPSTLKIKSRTSRLTLYTLLCRLNLARRARWTKRLRSCSLIKLQLNDNAIENSFPFSTTCEASFLGATRSAWEPESRGISSIFKLNVHVVNIKKFQC